MAALIGDLYPPAPPPPAVAVSPLSLLLYDKPILSSILPKDVFGNEATDDP